MKYFPHDTDSFDDEKITALFLKFGYEGLGLFYTILEKMAKAEKPITGDILKYQLGVGKGFGMKGKRLSNCWVFIEYLQLVVSKNGEYYNNRLQTLIQCSIYSKEKNKNKISKWREKQLDTKTVTSNETVTEPVRNDIDSIVDKIRLDVDERVPELFRQLKNITTDYDDEYLELQAKLLINKYPEIIARKSGALVNDWAGKIRIEDYLQWKKSKEKPVNNTAKFYTELHPEAKQW